MLSQDLKSVIRSIFRNRITSSISILGLGIGMGCIIILLALIIHERSFDTFIPDHKNLYRIILGSNSQLHYPLAEAVKGDFPEVKDFFRYYQTNSVQIKTPENVIVIGNNFGFADPSLFRILGIEFISGTPANSVSEVAISDESAMTYFGNLSPLGEVIPVRFPEGFLQLTVSGVYRRFPPNSTLDPSFITDILLSEKMFMQFQRSLGDYGYDDNQALGWRDTEFMSMILLGNNSDPDALVSKMDRYKEFFTNPGQDTLAFKLQPVADIYLGSQDISGNFFLRSGNPRELTYYQVISLLILLISLANHILLARAGMAGKMHEFGTRKVYGASHGKIRRLIILESLIIVLLSLVPAFFVIDYGIKFINDTLNKTLSGGIFLMPELWIMLILVVLFTGIISGWIIGWKYSRIPALRMISGINPVSSGSDRWNYSFLVLHFVIYMVLVSGVLAVAKQIRYSMTGYKGIRPENILVANLNSDELRNSFLTLCDEIEKIPGVQSTAGGSFIPPFGNFLPVNLALTTGERIRFDGLIMGEGMTELLGMEVIDGSSFGPYKEGPPEILINESAAKQQNVKAGENLLAFKVRGIVRDFHAHSLHTEIQPMVILPQNPARMGLIAVRTEGTNDSEIIGKMKDLFSQLAPDEIFEVNYLTDRIENFYSRERNHFRISGAFSLLALILSVMGLFGISLLSISKREKEIGIRKVNGSSVAEILLMLNSQFLRWVLAAVIISVPLSLWILSLWLQRFAYRTEMSWWIFALAGLSAVLIAILTVSWQSWRAATRNPVDALRYE